MTYNSYGELMDIHGRPLDLHRDETPVCPTCNDTGGWTWTVEGAGGRDEDVDTVCPDCRGER